MERYQQGFLNYLKTKRSGSTNTYKAYLNDLDRFIMFLKSEGITDFDGVDRIVVGNYLRKLRNDPNRKLSDKSVARHVSTLRSFYRYLIEFYDFKINPFEYVHSTKSYRKLPEFLFYEEMEELLNSIDTNEKFGLRNKALFELLYACGLRVSEVVDLKINDIDFYEMIIRVLGKGDKQRMIPFYPLVKDALQSYIDNERKVLMDAENS